MNPFDIVVVIILGFCLIRGLFRGLIKELFSIIGVLSGFYAAYTYYMKVAALFSGWISNTSYLKIFSFLIIFFGIFFIISMIGVVIKYVLNIIFLGWTDRIFGAVFGVIKGMLIVSVLMIIFTAFLSKDTLIKKSLLAPQVAIISENMAKILSKDMKNNFETRIKKIKKAWRKKTERAKRN